MSMLEDLQSSEMAALAKTKFANTPENFLIYAFEWLGDTQTDNCIMKITGAVFREAKSGPRKGQRVIKVDDTDQMVFFTPKEIEVFMEAYK